MRSTAWKTSGDPLSRSVDWSGSVWLDFAGRLMVVLGMIAPPLAILSVVTYYASQVNR
jgi:hypothetical protein